ncbi:hypothetical protein KFK09_018601 [Dendrobium nobile]|uniref:DUF4378 domain-containing protein n=1 Tax=Dendrobium nobile TaxID=94219 RepID=A0A8T3AVP6_DENNO|nr:hypothetical protein KFK09_018601 [Dendrobium nobile]
MAKKSHKRSPRLRKENSSCMGGLISMFDFRQGRSARLLSDKKCGSARDLGTSYPSNKDDLPGKNEENHGDAENLANLSDAEADETDKANLGVTSIKALMEEEMSRMHYPRKESSSKIEWLNAELELEAISEKSHNEQSKNGLVGSDDLANELNFSTRLTSQQSDYPNVSELLSSDIDVAAFMVDYCSTRDQYPSRVSMEDLQKSELDNEAVTILQKAIVDIAKALLQQKSSNSSKLVGNTEVQRAEEFSHALEMLNSNKDLFLKLLGEPNSPIRKHIENLQNVRIPPSKLDENHLLRELPGSKQHQKQSGHHLFRRREKFTVASQSNECTDAKVVNRIVILKPSFVKNQNHSNTVNTKSSIQSHCGVENKEDGEELSSHFSLKEIKRRFRNAVGGSRKERLSIAMDGILHKIPYGKQTSSKNETSCRREVLQSEDQKKSNNKEIQKKTELTFSTKSFREHKNLNKNAAPQILYREAAFYDEARKHLSELLQMESKVESLPAIQVSKSLGRILSFSGFNYFSPRLSPAREKEPESPQEKTSVFLCHSNQNVDTKYFNSSRHKESFPTTNNSQEAKNGSMIITEVEDCMQIEEGSHVEARFVSISNEDDLPSEIFKEEGSSMRLEPLKFEEMFQPSTPTASSSSALQEPRDTECAIDNTGRPSPISVLEPLYYEDVNSPASLITEHEINADSKTQPREPQIDTSAAASGSIDSEVNTLTCMEFDEASLFDELEISYGFLIKDPKFLFDSIDEVVTEIKQRHFSCSPWVSHIWPSIRRLQKQEDFINEAYKRINWHLDVQFPITMEQAVKKDFHGGAWFNLQLEAEDAVAEIGNEILDYLFEETALELWD